MFEAGGGFIEAAVAQGRTAASPRLRAAVESGELSAAQLVDRIGSWERSLRAVMAAQLGDLVAFDTAQRDADKAAGVGERLAGRTVAPQMASTLGVSAGAGTGRIAFARVVVHELCALWRVLGEGLLSEWHLRMVVAATDQLSAEQRRVVARQLAAEIRGRLSRGVRELTPHELGQAAARRAIEADPQAATRRYEKARQAREVSVTNKVNGTAALWVKGPAELTQHMFDEVESDARARRRNGDERSLDDLMFDQIYETLIGSMPAPGPDPMPEPREPDPADDVDAGSAARASTERPGLAACDLAPDDPAQETYVDDAGAVPAPPRRRLVPRRRKVEVQVLLAASTLLGLDDQPALLRGYGAIPAEIARQIADTSEHDHPARVLVRRLFCDPVDGRLLSMESRARCFTGPLRQFAIFRDQTCRVTGGRIRDIDHIIPAARSGPTSGANGQGLAKNPHVLRDHPAVRVRTRPYRPHPPGRPPDDPLDELRENAPDIEWIFPTGHRLHSEPPPALGHGSMNTGIDPPPVPPRPSEAEQDAALTRRKAELIRAMEHRRALHRQRLASPSLMERNLYRGMLLDPKFDGATD